MPTPLAKIKKIAINSFIILSLWIMVATNLNLSLSKIFFNQQTGYENKAAWANYYLSYADWAINYFGWAVGINNYWRMFSPISGPRWKIMIFGISNQNQKVLLPLPLQSPRSFIKQNFIDFRETKYLQNIYATPTGQEYYADYLCQTFQKYNIKSILIQKYSQEILDPNEAKQTRHYLGKTQIQTLNQFPCPR